MTRESTLRYLNKRYRTDPAFRLKRINQARIRQGIAPIATIEEARTTMKPDDNPT